MVIVGIAKFDVTWFRVLNVKWKSLGISVGDT